MPLASGDDASAGGGTGALVQQGEELFHREWMPDDPRSQGGDGLGPVYNDTSCVACHNLGAPGGGGPASKNVPILSAIDLTDTNVTFDGRIKGIFKSRPAEPGKGETRPPGDPGKKKADLAALSRCTPGSVPRGASSCTATAPTRPTRTGAGACSRRTRPKRKWRRS